MNKIVIGLLALGTTAQAQQALTLEQCKQMAKQNNVAMRSAANAEAQAEQQKKEAFTKYFPSVSGAAAAFTLKDPAIDINMMNMPIQAIEDGALVSVSATQPIFAGGQIVNGNKLAKVGSEAAVLQGKLSAKQVELQTEQYYWQLVTLQEKERTLNNVQDMLAQICKDVDMAVKAGVTLRNDLLQVQLRQNEVEIGKVQVENGISLSSMLLGQHIGQDSAVSLADPGLILDQVPELPIGLQKDVRTALTNTYEYQLLEKNVQVKELEKKMATGKTLPTLAVGAGITAYNVMEEWDNNAGVFATLSVPLTDWWGQSHAIKSKKIALEDARDQLNDNSAKLEIAMQKYWNDVVEAHKQLEIAHKSLEQSDENLRLNRQFYDAGTTTISDLLDAQQLYQQSRDSYVEAWAKYQMSITSYRLSTGSEAFSSSN